MPTATGVSTAYYVSPATYNSTSTSDVYTFFDTSTHSLSIGPVGSFSSANGYTLARIFSNGTKFTQVNDYRSIATLLSIT